jgi:hypothetical protein
MTRAHPGVGARHLHEGVALVPRIRILIRGETRGNGPGLVALDDMTTRPLRAS